MFTIIKHGPKLWEVTGRFTLRGKVGAGEASQQCRSKSEAVRLATSWTLTEIRAQTDLAAERIVRLEIAREYLAARAARPSASQISFDF